MSVKRFRIFALAAGVLLMCACGKRYKAESTVKNFVGENILVKDYSMDFAKFDSTVHLNDSILTRMKISARGNSLFKKNINYGTTAGKGKYAYVQTKIYTGKDTLTHTFYLDMNLSEVIAFKRNG